MKDMRKNGIEVQIGTYALHHHRAFQNNPLIELFGSLNNSTWCFSHTLSLPLFNELTIDQQELIVKELISRV
jgi:dTDP-4-amino-4,6-dideoxygalactose transaminase